VTDDGLWRLPAVEQAEGVRRGLWSAEELARSVLARIAERNPEINAYCTLADAAVADARAADRERLRGTLPGPLSGVPFSVKDLIPAEGVRTTMGSMAYADWVPDQDDVAVARLRAAGAILVGKTNTRELGYGIVADNDLFGPTRNPRCPDRTAGGSSGGAAAAVADGMGSVALGSDGGGSLRVPAALCGVFAIKPSFGVVPVYPSCRVPLGPGFSSWESLECVGPLTRTVRDATAVMAVIAGFDARDRHSVPFPADSLTGCLEEGVTGLRVAWSPRLGGAEVSPEILEVTGAAVRVLDGLGCAVESADPPIGDLRDLRAVFAATVARDSDLVGLRDMASRYDVSVDIRELVSRPWDGDMLTIAAMRRQVLYDSVRAFMERYDVLVTPATATPAFPVGLRQPADGTEGIASGRDWSPFAFPFNLTGQPAASLPVGQTQAGLPVGLQIVGRRLADETVLRVAYALEQALSTALSKAKAPNRATG
jgi:aspartyl-tRNA(Asn)/glutamyl-tRNA(Gln) amidotransferase subunit A